LGLLQSFLCDLGNRPDETGHLAGNGGRDDDLWLAGGGEATIPRAEPDLPLPGNVADRRGQRFEAIVKLRLTRAGMRYVQTPSIRTRRARVLPALVIPARRMLPPEECSLGTRPR
jgi:hypothetical protein